MFAAKYKPAGRAAKAVATIGRLKAVLFVLTTFVIYAQPGLQAQVDRVHTRLVAEYRAAGDRARNARADDLAQRALNESVSSMTQSGRAQLGAVIERIDETAGDPFSRTSIEATIGGGQVPTGSDGDPPPLPAAITATPTSDRQLDRQLRDVASERENADQAVRRSELSEGLVLVAAQLISAATPRVNPEWVRITLDALVDRVSNRVKQTIDRRLASADAQADTRAAENELVVRWSAHEPRSEPSTTENPARNGPAWFDQRGPRGNDPVTPLLKPPDPEDVFRDGAGPS
jgi:hypothetical protein